MAHSTHVVVVDVHEERDLEAIVRGVVNDVAHASNWRTLFSDLLREVHGLHSLVVRTVIKGEVVAVASRAPLLDASETIGRTALCEGIGGVLQVERFVLRRIELGQVSHDGV